MAHLVFHARGRPAAVHRLVLTVSIGRSLDCDLFIPDVFVSRHHCHIETTDTGWEVVDNGSANGVFFRGHRIARRTLHDGDLIEIGTVAMQYREGEPADVQTTRLPYGAATAVSELLDTVFALDMRPVQFLQSSCRKGLWTAGRRIGRGPG